LAHAGGIARARRGPQGPPSIPCARIADTRNPSPGVDRRRRRAGRAAETAESPAGVAVRVAVLRPHESTLIAAQYAHPAGGDACVLPALAGRARTASDEQGRGEKTDAKHGHQGTASVAILRPRAACAPRGASLIASPLNDLRTVAEPAGERSGV
jgi:hypothetical protein